MGKIFTLVRHTILVAWLVFAVPIDAQTLNADLQTPEQGGTFVVPAHVTRTLPQLELRCVAPDSLRYDEAADVYLGNPFLLQIECRNTGLVDAVGAAAVLHLPAGVALASTQDSLRRVCPFVLHEWKPGDTAWSASWLLRYVDTTFAVQPQRCEVSVSALTPEGLPSDSAWCASVIHLRPPLPRLEVVQHLTLPDSISATPDRRALTPNPFTASFALRNAGTRTYSDLSFITLTCATDVGLIFDVATPSVQYINSPLHAGDTLRVSWTIRVELWQRRRVPFLNVIAYSKDGTPWAFCQDLLPIDAVDTTATGVDSKSTFPRTPAFSVVPHPVRDLARITFAGAIHHGVLSICDLLGREVYSGTLDGFQPGRSISIDLSAQPRGIYLLRLQHDGVTSTALILKD